MFSGSTTLARYTPINISIWFSMAFQAGAINAGGFLACHKTVTHVTGFATYFGAEASQGNFGKAMGFLSVPFFFLAGAMISAYFVDRKITKGEQPRYYYMFALISTLMMFVALAGTLGYFGGFGAPMNLSKDYLMLAILCLSSGIQNACITSASGSVVRTTHLTGLTTDLGIGLMRRMTRNPNDIFHNPETSANMMRIGIIFFFVLGSTLAALSFNLLGYLGFLGPAMISLILTYIAYTKKNGSQDSSAETATDKVAHG